MTNGFQLVMPLDCEVNIEKNAPVRLLNAVMERMDYSKLYAAYSRLGRIEYSPKILLKIMVYGYMRKQMAQESMGRASLRQGRGFIASANATSAASSCLLAALLFCSFLSFP